MDNTISLHGILNGDLEVNGNLVEPNISTQENGAQAGTKNGSPHGPPVTGDGTSTSGLNMIRNARPVACVREVALLNTGLKKLLKNMMTQRRSLNHFTNQCLKSKRRLRV